MPDWTGREEEYSKVPSHDQRPADEPFPADCIDDLKAILDYWWERRAGNHWGERAGKESPECTKNAEKMYNWIARRREND